jgi:hypothetical protein
MKDPDFAAQKDQAPLGNDIDAAPDEVAGIYTWRQLAWIRFKKHRLAMVGGVVLIIM